MEKFPLKGVREIVAEGNNYLTAYQSVLKKVNIIYNCRKLNFNLNMYDESEACYFCTLYINIIKLFMEHLFFIHRTFINENSKAFFIMYELT